jgi:hypothetical protein
LALTPFQRAICRPLADHRIASGKSDVARGSAFNELIAARSSVDRPLFHRGYIRGALPTLISRD